ncbi:MAG: hybrid sensor histidine kinase/response regulator [Candidatus Methanoperedens sp.]|nr:hybrid sensor histidine kinase/response regulator [Candidatus Methanoperedens sp.]
MKILVVDDNINDRNLLLELLNADGYEVTSASNGVEALEKIRESKPDLVISDIMMPEMDGFGLCRELKKTVETIKIPVILYSSSFTDREDEKLVMEEGAAAYIRKPFEIKPFLEKIREIITGYKAGKISQPMPGILDEKEYLSLYSRRLMKKLENKVFELENANKKLETALSELETIDRLKDNILANVTHELRTPLTHALGYVELAISETDETKKKEYSRRSRDALLRENEVITHLVEAAYADKGLLKPVFETMNVAQIINETIQALLPKAQAYSILVSCEVKDELFAKGDRNQIKHVLENLLDNAIKFNRKGGKVEISACREDEMVKVCVKDTGIGIPEEKMGKLFDKMYQVDSETTRKFGGIGLGLSIAKNIVEAHEGRIWVESKAGEGSKFYFTMPAQERT